jgi:hypothetical protein
MHAAPSLFNRGADEGGLRAAEDLPLQHGHRPISHASTPASEDASEVPMKVA